MGKLDKKAALVTGGSRGIGAAIAHRFAAEGADVAFTYLGNKNAADASLKSIEAFGRRAVAIQADVGDIGSSRAAVNAALKALGRLDILVHNAGVSEYLSISGVDQGAYLDLHRRHVSTNIDGVVALTTAAVPHMSDGGRIVLIGSINAHQMPFEGTAIYGASKAAVAALAQGWARDLGPRGILVNVVQPGPIDTDMNPDDDREAVKVMTSMTALKRYGRADEIAAAVTFFASDDASFITGASLDVDGGMSI